MEEEILKIEVVKKENTEETVTTTVLQFERVDKGEIIQEKLLLDVNQEKNESFKRSNKDWKSRRKQMQKEGEETKEGEVTEERKEGDTEEKKRRDSERKKRDNFTHFFSLPLYSQEFKQATLNLMNNMLGKLDEKVRPFLKKQDLNTIHLTLSMLTLPDIETKEKVAKVFQEKEQEILKIFEKPFHLTFEKVDVFWERGGGKRKTPRVIFLKLKHDENVEKLSQLCHLLISQMLEMGIFKEKDLKRMNLTLNKFTNLYTPEHFHVTLFRTKKYGHSGCGDFDFQAFLKEYEKIDFGTFLVNKIDISTRFKFDEDKFYLPLSRILLKHQEQEQKLNQENC